MGEARPERRTPGSARWVGSPPPYVPCASRPISPIIRRARGDVATDASIRIGVGTLLATVYFPEHFWLHIWSGHAVAFLALGALIYLGLRAGRDECVL